MPQDEAGELQSLRDVAGAINREISKAQQHGWEAEARGALQYVDTDANARRIIDSYCVGDVPFALYLRNFESEAYDYPLVNRSDSTTSSAITFIAFGGSEVEHHLGRLFAGRIALLGIANPSRLTPPDSDIPRLELPRDDWSEVVDMLMEASQFILSTVSTISPGVAFECNRLRELGRQHDTVVILANPPEESDSNRLHAQLSGAVLPKHQVPTREQLVKMGFHHVIFEDDLLSTPADSSSILSLVLPDDTSPRTGEKRRSGQHGGSLEHRVRWARRWAILESRSGKGAEAVNLLGQMLPHARRAGSPNEEALMVDMGKAYLEDKKLSEAMGSFAASGLLSLKNENLGGARFSNFWIGLALWVARNYGRSTSILERTCRWAEACGDVECLRETLAALISVHAALGEDEVAGQCRLKLAEIQRIYFPDDDGPRQERVEAPDTIQRAGLEMGITLNTVGDYRNAELMFDKAYKWAWKAEDLDSVVESLDGFLTIERARGNAQAVAALEKQSSALARAQTSKESQAAFWKFVRSTEVEAGGVGEHEG